MGAKKLKKLLLMLGSKFGTSFIAYIDIIKPIFYTDRSDTNGTLQQDRPFILRKQIRCVLFSLKTTTWMKATYLFY